MNKSEPSLPTPRHSEVLAELRAKIKACVDADALDYDGDEGRNAQKKQDAGIDLDDFVMVNGEELVAALTVALSEIGAAIVQVLPLQPQPETITTTTAGTHPGTTCEGMRNIATRAPQSAGVAFTDDDLRRMWKAAGGTFHGPNVEHGTMPEENLLRFLREITGLKPRSATEAPIKEKVASWFAAYDDGRWDADDVIINVAHALGIKPPEILKDATVGPSTTEGT